MLQEKANPLKVTQVMGLYGMHIFLWGDTGQIIILEYSTPIYLNLVSSIKLR